MCPRSSGERRRSQRAPPTAKQKYAAVAVRVPRVRRRARIAHPREIARGGPRRRPRLRLSRPSRLSSSQHFMWPRAAVARRCYDRNCSMNWRTCLATSGKALASGTSCAPAREGASIGASHRSWHTRAGASSETRDDAARGARPGKARRTAAVEVLDHRRLLEGEAREAAATLDRDDLVVGRVDEERGKLAGPRLEDALDCWHTSSGRREAAESGRAARRSTTGVCERRAGAARASGAQERRTGAACRSGPRGAHRVAHPTRSLQSRRRT